MQPVQPQPQRYTTSYIMSNHGSVVSSVAPSARNSPPMQPMQPRIAVPAFQQLEPARQYVPVGSQYARASVGHGYPSQSQVRLLAWGKHVFAAAIRSCAFTEHSFSYLRSFHVHLSSLFLWTYTACTILTHVLHHLHHHPPSYVVLRCIHCPTTCTTMLPHSTLQNTIMSTVCPLSATYNACM